MLTRKWNVWNVFFGESRLPAVPLFMILACLVLAGGGLKSGMAHAEQEADPLKVDYVEASTVYPESDPKNVLLAGGGPWIANSNQPGEWLEIGFAAPQHIQRIQIVVPVALKDFIPLAGDMELAVAADGNTDEWKLLGSIQLQDFTVTDGAVDVRLDVDAPNTKRFRLAFTSNTLHPEAYHHVQHISFNGQALQENPDAPQKPQEEVQPPRPKSETEALIRSLRSQAPVLSDPAFTYSSGEGTASGLGASWSAASGAPGEWIEAAWDSPVQLEAIRIEIPADDSGALQAGSFRVEAWRGERWHNAGLFELSSYRNVEGSVSLEAKLDQAEATRYRLLFITPPHSEAAHKITALEIVGAEPPAGVRVEDSQISSMSSSTVRVNNATEQYARDLLDTTSWMAKSRHAGEWFQADFYSPIPLTGVTVVLPAVYGIGNLLAGDFDILVRQEGEWQTVAAVSLDQYAKMLGPLRLHVPFPEIVGDAIQLTFTSEPQHTGGYHQIAEFMPYRAAEGWMSAGIGLPGDTVDSSLWQAAASTEQSGHAASNLLDGDDTTYWAASGEDGSPWLRVDLQQSRILTGVMGMVPADEDGKLITADWTIEALVDGNWQPLHEVALARYGQLAPGTLQRILVSFEPIHTQALRITFSAGKDGETGGTDGKRVHLASLAVYEQPVWLREKAGYIERVPAPWSPMRLAGNEAIFSSGSSFTFGSDAVPTAATAAGQTLLAADMKLVASYKGKEQPVQPVRGWSEQQDGASATVHREGNWGNVRWQSSMAMAYDGMMQVDLRLQTGAGVAELDELVLQIPFASAVAAGIHSPNNTYEPVTMALPQGDGVVWSSAQFRPSVWIGDNDKGFSWFADSHAGWVARRDQQEALMWVERSGDVTYLSIKLVGDALPAESSHHIVFGLQATPIHAMPELQDAKQLIFDIGGNMPATGKTSTTRMELGRINSKVLWWNPVSRWFGMPDPKDESQYRRMAEMAIRMNWRSLSYHSVTSLGIESPLYRHYGEAWRSTPGAIIENVEGYGSTYSVSPATTWADYLADAIKQHLRKYPLDGVYLDMTYPDLDSRHSSSGYTEYAVLSERALLQRIYHVVADNSPATTHEAALMLASRTDMPARYKAALLQEAYTDNQLGKAEMILHNSANLYIPHMAFATSYLNGEQFHLRSEFQDMTPEKFRIEFMGHNFGVQAHLLPEVTFPVRAQEGFSARNLIATALPHRIVPTNAWIDAHLINRIWQVYDRLPVWSPEVSWIPYWEASSPFAATNPDLKVSAYTKPDGEGIVIVSNLSQTEAVTESVLVAWADNKEVIVEQYLAPSLIGDGQVMAVEGGRATVTLDPLDVILLYVRPGTN